MIKTDKNFVQKRVAQTAAAFVLGTSLTACVDSAEPQEKAAIYCIVDETDGNQAGDNLLVLPADQCQEAEDTGYYNGHFVYYWASTTPYPPNTYVPRSSLGSTTPVRVNDPAARTRAGLPSSGRLAGTSVTRTSGAGGFTSKGGGGG